MKNNQEFSDIKSILEELKQQLGIVSEGVNLFKEFVKKPVDIKCEQLFNSVTVNLERSNALLNGVLESIEGKTYSKPSTHFDVLHQIQQVCSTHDQLFLQRQLRYKVTASADLPHVFANPDQIFIVLSHLVSNAIKFSPRSSEIEIKAKEVNLRQGAGVEISVINESQNFTEKDRYQIFEKFYNNCKSDSQKSGGVGLAVCREVIQKLHGQLWVDIPVKGKVSFTFVLPCTEVSEKDKPKSHRIYKYDISIANHSELKEKIGDDKFGQLLQRLEESVRRLVRHPIDVVASFEAHGVVSVIYETQEGNASSVATRISQKLGAEDFKTGKIAIPVALKYHLSALQ